LNRLHSFAKNIGDVSYSTETLIPIILRISDLVEHCIKRVYLCYVLIFGSFPGVRILYADVSKHSVSEMSVYKILTPGKHPKIRIRNSEHSESFRSRLVYSCTTFRTLTVLVFRHTDRRWYYYMDKIGLCKECTPRHFSLLMYTAFFM